MIRIKKPKITKFSKKITDHYLFSGLDSKLTIMAHSHETKNDDGSIKFRLVLNSLYTVVE